MTIFERMRKVQRLVAILMVIVFGLFLVGCNDNQEEEKVIGLVNGTEITQQDLDQYYFMIKTGYESQMGNEIDEEKDIDLINELKERSFDDLVVYTLVTQDAQKQGIEITEQEINEDLNNFKATRGEEGYNVFLQQIGMTEATFKEQIKMEKLFIALSEKVVGDIDISDEEVKAFYDENQEIFVEPSGMEISHILVENEDEAMDILAQLKEGGDFSELAREFSICPSKEEGGDLGLVNENTSLVEEFKDAALELKNGEMTEVPVKSDFGYHIIKAGNFKEATPVPYASIKDDIARQLEANKKNEIFADYLKELRENAEIEDKR
ncbi:MAG TPA: SurA N-terminal domain-containing protein [Syntrophomonadaceae bacterium]|nr:SurA N-terminal domain-containing protein [Syntrophomonadaceae bacterium]